MEMRYLRMCKIFVMKDKSEIIGILWRKVDHSYSMENHDKEKQTTGDESEDRTASSNQNGTISSKQNGTTSPASSNQNGGTSSASKQEPHTFYNRSVSTVSTKIDRLYNKTIGAVSRKIVLTLGNGFHRWGELVVTYPWSTILASLLLCFLFSGGLLLYRVETDQAVLWTPYDSPFTAYKEWIDKEFPPDRRSEFVLASSEDNVLTAKTIKYLFDLDVRIRTTQSPLADNQTYTDLCYSYPKIARKSQKLFNATKNCQKIIKNLYFESIEEEPCITSGVLGLFRNIMANLTDELVKDTVTCVLHDSSLKDQLGNFIANVKWENGKVLKADAILLIWLLAENSTQNTDQEERKIEVLEGKLYKPKAKTVAENWEKFVFTEEILNKNHSHRPPGLTINALAQRSFEDEVMESVNSNYAILSIGFLILFVYVALILGNLNYIEQKVLLSLCGILVVIMAIASSFGLCFYIGLAMNDIVPITPFLLLGIGVDDMFIMVQSLSCSEKDVPIKEKVALALKHAGLSITVTSMTDMAAFAIGATSSMPSLRTFCLFATLGVLFLYIYSITFFVACMILDEERQRKQIKAHPDWNPPAWTRAKPGTVFFNDYLAKWILKWPVQLLVLAFSLGLFSFGFYGLLNISSNFDSTLYLRSDSNPVKYIKEVRSLFPNELVDVYIGQIDYSTERDCLENMTTSLKHNEYVDDKSVDFWYSTFVSKFDWCIQNKNISFKSCVGQFLLHVPHYFQDVKLTIDLQDNDNSAALLKEGQFNITASRAKFQYKKFHDTNAQNEAMLQVREEMAKISFSGEDNDFPPIPYTIKFIQWDANRVMSTELLRNLGLTFGTILVISILLLADIFVSFLVFLCVLATIVDITGFAFFMGIHIEIITSIILILSVGLGLDYVSHIGVTYVVTIEGSRRERAASALGQMGMPVFNGGFSTFLAFILLSKSDSYVFLTFFQMFAMVVLFGLFHGLLVLPVLLALVGPQSSKEKIIMRERVLTASKEKQKLKIKDLNGVVGPQSDPEENVEKGQNGAISDTEKDIEKGQNIAKVTSLSS